MKKYDTQIEAYLSGELNAAARADFEQAMQSDPKLAQSVEAHRMMQQHLWGMQLRQKVDAVMAETPATDGFKNRMGWLYLALAALLAAFFCFLYFKTSPSTPKRPDAPTSPIRQETPMVEDKTTEPIATISKPAPPSNNTNRVRRYSALAQAFYQPPGSDFIRSTDTAADASSAIEQAKDAFFAGNYPLAARLLRNDSEWAKEEPVRFLRACARFKTEDYAGAEQDFQRLENSFQYRYEARWHGLLCQLAQGNINQPRNRALLERMAADADFPYQEQAKALIKQL